MIIVQLHVASMNYLVSKPTCNYLNTSTIYMRSYATVKQLQSNKNIHICVVWAFLSHQCAWLNLYSFHPCYIHKRKCVCFCTICNCAVTIFLSWPPLMNCDHLLLLHKCYLYYLTNCKGIWEKGPLWTKCQNWQFCTYHNLKTPSCKSTKCRLCWGLCHAVLKPRPTNYWNFTGECNFVCS